MPIRHVTIPTTIRESTSGIFMKLRMVFINVLLAVGATVASGGPNWNLPEQTLIESGWKVDREKLRTAQIELRRRGHSDLEPTGRLDRRTRTAIAAYQSAAGLPVTARLDRPTYESLTSGKLSGSRQSLENSANDLEPNQAARPGSSGRGIAVRAFGSIRSGLSAGTRGLGRSAQQLDRTFLTRDDEALLREVRELLDNDPSTMRWAVQVRDGLVTVRTDPRNRIDNGPVITGIRRIAGVRSVMVIAM